MEIEEGLHRIEGRLSNLYIVTRSSGRDQEPYLVDSGMSSDYREISDYMDEREIDRENVNTILLTHADMDHAGGAAKIKEDSDCEVALHRLEKNQLETDDNPSRVKFAAGRAGVQVQNSVQIDRVLEKGDSIGPFRTLETPGHTEGSISFFLEEKGWIFVGDAVRTDRNGDFMFLSEKNTKDLDQALSSLQKISRLEFDSLFPGHGEPVKERASEKLKEFLKLI